METVMISKNKNIEIPENLRNFLNIAPGSKLQVLEKNGHIELVPELDIHDLFGLYPNIDTELIRDNDRV
jgi:AbrB family looped-hinge helix DNA binding protein